MKSERPSILLLPFLLAAVGALAWLWWPDDGLPGPGDPGPVGSERDDSGDDKSGPARAFVRRSEAGDGAGEETGPRASEVVLRVVEHETLAAIAHAEAYAFRGGEQLGVSSADGRLSLRVTRGVPIVIAARGYLLRLVSLRPEMADGDPPVVQLVRDRYTLPQSFRFVGDDRRPVDSVVVRFHPDWEVAESPSPLASMPALPADTPNPILRAWNDHLLVSTTAAFQPAVLQAGHMNAARSFTLSGEDQVRFARPGTYRLHAATAEGLVGRAVFQVPGDTLTVPMAEGRAVSGRVLASEDDAPVVGARVALLGGDPLGTHAVTDTGGRFRIAPVAPGAVTLEVTHPDRETLRHGPVFAAGELELRMAALSTRTLRGRVRARPSLEPLSDARVLVRSGDEHVARTSTDVHGRFSVEVPANGILRLTIEHTDHLPYVEILAAEAGTLDYDLLPAREAERVRAGLSTVLIGSATGPDGAPAAGVTVRLAPEQPSLPALRSGRRILEGGVLSPPLTATTDASGSFRIETVQEGRARLFVLGDPGASPAVLALRRGEVLEGLRLVTTKKP